jgi:hypothetical protein
MSETPGEGTKLWWQVWATKTVFNDGRWRVVDYRGQTQLFQFGPDSALTGRSGHQPADGLYESVENDPLPTSGGYRSR